VKQTLDEWTWRLDLGKDGDKVRSLMVRQVGKAVEESYARCAAAAKGKQP